MLTVTAKNHAALFPRFEAKFSSSKENLTTKSGRESAPRVAAEAVGQPAAKRLFGIRDDVAWAD
jgi:hypothetical protein